jgi:hypothetical protein
MPESSYDHVTPLDFAQIAAGKAAEFKAGISVDADMPIGGRRVELTILARRFWCDAVLCGRRVFNEQFGNGVLARYGR